VTLVQGSHIFTDKRSHDYPGPSKHFPEPSWRLPTFKYKDKQQLITADTECHPMHNVPYGACGMPNIS